MIPYDIDPSLHSGDPAPPMLDDGFSPPSVRESPPTDVADGQDDPDAAMSQPAP